MAPVNRDMSRLAMDCKVHADTRTWDFTALPVTDELLTRIVVRQGILPSSSESIANALAFALFQALASAGARRLVLPDGRLLSVAALSRAIYSLPSLRMLSLPTPTLALDDTLVAALNSHPTCLVGLNFRPIAAQVTASSTCG